MSRVVLVTGSEGFLGRHVVAELSRSHDTEVVRLGRHRPKAYRDGGARFVQADLSHEVGAMEISRIQPDVVVHLAWEGLSDFRSQHHVDQVASHARLFETLIGAGVKRIVGVGTCLEYGQVEGELHESMAPRPAVAYAEGKTRLREQVERLAEKSGVNWCWARIFYPYGPGQQEKSLWSALNAAIDRNDVEFPMSSGEQLRDYLHVSEVGRILALLAQSDSATGPINVCSGEPVTVRELVERWIAERGSDICPKLGVFQHPDYEPMAFWGSTGLLDIALKAGLGADESPRARAGERC